MPHKIHGQHVNYMFQTPTTQVWNRLHQQGRLNAAQDIFWNTKPAEELYDLASDPDEVKNLALSPQHQDILTKLRVAQRRLALTIRDVGFLPEGEIHARAEGTTPYDMARDNAKYPFERIFAVAELAAGLDPAATAKLSEAMDDRDSAVRYWAALGLLMRETAGVQAGRAELLTARNDPSPYVRIVAAEALARFGGEQDLQPSLALLSQLADWGQNNVFVAMAALNAIDALGEKGVPARSAFRRPPQKGTMPDARYGEYVPRLLESLK